MSGINKVMCLGNLGKDPEIKFLDGGNAVANFSVAVNESYKNKAGEKVEKTEWVKVVAWGKLAELCGEYLKKGRQVLIEGKLQTREYEKDGQKKYVTEIVAQNVTFLGGKSDSPGGSAGSARDPGADDDVSF